MLTMSGINSIARLRFMSSEPHIATYMYTLVNHCMGQCMMLRLKVYRSGYYKTKVVARSESLCVC